MKNIKNLFKVVLSLIIVFVIVNLLFVLQRQVHKEIVKESEKSGKSERSEESKGSEESERSEIKEDFLKPKFDMTTSDIKFSFKKSSEVKTKDLKNFKGLKNLDVSSLTSSKSEYGVKMLPQGSISGTAVLQDSQFNEGICISLEKTGYSTYTDERGRYSLQFLPPGNYTLVASMPEYISEKRENITVSTGELKVAEIVLKPNFDVTYPKIIRVKPERNSKNVPVPNSSGISGIEKEIGRTGLCICLDFSKPMNRESVEKNISFEPPLKCTFQWIGNRRVILKTHTSLPIDPLKLNTQYKILFKGEVLSIDGKKMLDTTPIEFTTGGFKVVETNPKNNSNNHAPNNKLFEIFFNSPVDRTIVNNETFIISPNIEGKINFSDTNLNYLSYSSIKNLPSDTKYVITLKKDIKDVYGVSMEEDFNLTFLTAPLKITNVWPKDNDKNVLTSSYPYIFFNATVDRDSFKKAFTISPEIKGDFVWSVDKNGEEYCNFVHSDYFNTNTIYKINISDDVVDVYGKKMQKPYSFSFKTELPRVSYMRPDSGTIDVGTNEEIKLIFNTLMDRQETLKFVSISPQEDVLFHWGSEKNYDILSIEPKHKWKSHSRYTFVVSSKAKDLNGNEMSSEFKGEIFTR